MVKGAEIVHGLVWRGAFFACHHSLFSSCCEPTPCVNAKIETDLQCLLLGPRLAGKPVQNEEQRKRL